VQLGFVIDHSRCIGCHACTVACKSENDVPLGKARTWVKYTERGTFPDVRRSFAVLRCNQCTDAPCVAICPVGALEKRPDGIVDVDPAACIGCKACMQGCPYDALYLSERSGTAEKCHFCLHRTEIGLAPACAVVCPTEAIVPGDFHDASSIVSRLRAAHDLTVRKPEAGTRPNVHYREVDPAGIDPAATNAAGGYLWSNQVPGLQIEADKFEAARAEAETRARTTYDVEHATHWGFKVSAYLFTKALSAGVFLVLTLLLTPLGGPGGLNPAGSAWLSGIALSFLIVTSVLLICDLKRPERFFYILTRPNWSSWLVRGTVILTGYGGLLTLWLAVSLRGVDVRALTLFLVPAGAIFAAATACYTGWLFAQAKGRVLWMRPGLALHLFVQAFVAGAAFVLPILPWLRSEPIATDLVRWGLVVSLLLHAALTLTEGRMAPAGREAEYSRVMALVTHGPFARRHRWGGLALGIAAPLVLLAVSTSPLLLAVASVAALAGLYLEKDILVRAGQALPIS
jgi:Fe-S-cluster-containing dehydrogenase component/formate-dependent nitrite reductase membrane component NrfD